MTGLTLLLAAPTVSAGSLAVGITDRLVGEVVLMAAIGAVAVCNFSREEMVGWFWETGRFVEQIFPLLIVGVFLAGIAHVTIPESQVQSSAGRNTPLTNLIGVVFGMFMYFPHWWK